MRIQNFMQFLQGNLNLDLPKAKYFLTDPNFKGGWEVWLQCNIGYAGRRVSDRSVMTREACYPGQDDPYLSWDKKTQKANVTKDSRAAARCDFLIENVEGLADSTYVELKCATSSEDIKNTWIRFAADMTKIRALNQLNQTINCAALLAVWGPLTTEQIDVANRSIFTCFALDYSPGQGEQPVLTNFAEQSSSGDSRMLLFGFSPHLKF